MASGGSQICVTDKPLSEYYKRSNGKGIYKYRSDCKACKKLYDRERYIKLGGKRNTGRGLEQSEKSKRELRERILEEESNSADVHWSLI